VIEEVCANIRPEPLTRVVPHCVGSDAAKSYVVVVGFRLALALLVTRVLADHHDVSVATNDFALVADWFDAGVDLHCVLLVCWRRTRLFRAVPSVWLLVAINDATS
jgi:hypothetical protein